METFKRFLMAVGGIAILGIVVFGGIKIANALTNTGYKTGIEECTIERASAEAALRQERDDHLFERSAAVALVNAKNAIPDKVESVTVCVPFSGNITVARSKDGCHQTAVPVAFPIYYDGYGNRTVGTPSIVRK